jgi:hypothetical protein
MIGYDSISSQAHRSKNEVFIPLSQHRRAIAASHAHRISKFRTGVLVFGKKIKQKQLKTPGTN